MNKKIINLRQINKLIKPYTATLVGGVFDLFHVGHLRYLKAASKHSRPLVVSVQSDKTTRIRKGFNRPIINQEQRAEIIAELEFVDYVLILDKPSHYDKYLEILKPKYLIFYKENLTYRKRRAKDIQNKFSFIKVVFVDTGRKTISTTKIAKKILAQPNFNKIKDKIARNLHIQASQSQARVGKISALIVYKNKIILSNNNTKSEVHAEVVALRKAIKKKIPLKKCKIYILIPPCISCAEEIYKKGIETVYYLYPYGNDDGIKFLRKHGVKVKRYNFR